MERFWKKVCRTLPDKCWEWQGCLDRQNYGMFYIDGKMRKASRVSAFLSGLLDNLNQQIFVLHKCDNSKCVNPDHLELGNNSKNQKDAYKRGRRKPKIPILCGENNGRSKLLTEDIIKIRKLYNHGLTRQELANRYNISQVHIGDIINRKSWKHIK